MIVSVFVRRLKPGPTFDDFGKRFGQDNIDKIKNYK